jgi:3-hydroxyisobutyryl-CoA hydrolase
LTGPNVFYTGIATHYLHSTSLPDVEARLGELRFSDSDSKSERLAMISQTLEEFATGFPHDQPMQISGEIREAIDRCFSKNNVADIIQALNEERGSAVEEWAQKQLATLKKRSPTAVHVALRQMRVGRKWDLVETFNKEHQIASKFMQHPDFTEGVTALLVRKEAPKWQPESLEAIPTSDDVTKPFFTFDSKHDVGLFTDRNYRQYPNSELGVPSESEVEETLRAGGGELSRGGLINAVVASRQGRQGIKTVVKEIVARKTEVDSLGKAIWIRSGSASSKL